MFIQKFINELNKEIKNKIKTGFLKEKYFTTCHHNDQSEVHSRVQAIITYVCYKLGFDVEIERHFKYVHNGKSKSSKSDISIYKKGKLYAFIEYDSTDSADARFYDIDGELWDTSGLRKLKGYYDDSCANEEFPENWVFISTLPNEKVLKEDWKSWEFLRSDPKFDKVIKSPYKYYSPKYIEKTKRMLRDNKKIKVKVFLLNLDRNQINLEYKN